jgi:hypothetical protein
MSGLKPEVDDPDVDGEATEDYDFTVEDIEEHVPTDLNPPEDFDDGSDPNQR